MHARIHQNLVARFWYLLSEGFLCGIKSLKVVASTNKYRPLSSEGNTINFNSYISEDN